MQEHRERADNAAVTDVFSSAAPAQFCNRRQELEVRTEAFRGNVAAGVPKRLFVPPTPPQIDRDQKIVARDCVETGNQTLRFAENRRREIGGVLVCHGRVAPDNRNSIGNGCGAHSLPNDTGPIKARGPKDVDDRQRTSPHRRNVAEIHHHCRVTRKPGVICDERRQHSFRREQEPVLSVPYRRAIVSDTCFAGQSLCRLIRLLDPYFVPD